MTKNFKIYVFITLSALLIYLNYFHTAPYKNNEDYLFWGQLNILLHVIPIFGYFNRVNRNNAFPFIALLAFFQILTYGLPVYFIRIDSFQLNNQLNLDVLKVSFISFLIFYATYFGMYNHIFRTIRAFHPIPKNATDSFLNLTRYIFLLIYLISIFYKVEAIQHLGNFSLYVYLGFTISILLRKRMSFIEILIFLIVLVFELLDRLTSGLIATLAILILFLCLLVFIDNTKKYLIPVFLVPFFLFYTIFSSVKGTFRSLTWYGNKQYSYIEKITLISDLVQDDKSSSLIKDEQGNDNLFWRFSYPMSALSMVLEKTPKDVPFWKGDSYAPLFTKFIPRIFYPSKPQENMGQRFGKTYHLIRQSDNATSMNTPILAEMYMNFGYSGLYIGMFLFALLFIFLNKVFNNRSVSKENIVVNMAILFPLIILESNFSLVYGNLILICISLYILFRIFKFA